MRSAARNLVLGVALLAVSFSTASAATDQERFEKLVGKLDQSFTKFKPKQLCICTATGEIGVVDLPSIPDPFAYCGKPQFGADGNLTGFSNCGSFIVVKP